MSALNGLLAIRRYSVDHRDVLLPPDFFRLEFTIPEFVADMLNARTEQQLARGERWPQIANIKQQYVRFVDVTTITEGQLLSFRLSLDVNWLNRYLEGLRLREER